MYANGHKRTSAKAKIACPVSLLPGRHRRSEVSPACSKIRAREDGINASRPGHGRCQGIMGQAE